MSKRILLIAMMCCVNILLHAQQAVGQWQLYPTKSTVAGIVYESNGDEVYYMSGSNLFSYDKSTSEIETYNTGNYLSDNGIKNIYYNYDKSYLMIIYDNSNIDLVYSDKRVINIPDLKNTIMMYSKSINDVVFGKDKIYLATDFGIVILNDDRYEVFESYIYGKSITKMTIVGEFLMIYTDGELYMTSNKPGLYDFSSSWRRVDMGNITPTKVSYLYTINDRQVFFACDDKSYIFNLEDYSFTEQSVSYYCYASSINKTKSGYLFSFEDIARFISSDFTEDNQLKVIETKRLTDTKLQKGYYSSYNNDNTVWCCTAAGISHVDIDAKNNNLTWLVTPTGYNTSSVSNPQYIQVHNNRLYVKNMGPYMYSSDMTTATVISVCDLDNYEWSELGLDNVQLHYGSSKEGALRSSLNMAFDPDSSDIFYTGSWFDGIHKFDGCEYVGNYNTTNSPLDRPWAMLASFSDFDRDGNLWTVMVNNTVTKNALLACLPADKKVKDPATVEISDWVTYDVGANIDYFINLLVCKRSPYVFVIHSRLVSPTRITVINRNTGESRIFSTFIDQDGGSFGNGVLNFITAQEDKNGNVWIGTTSGPIVLNNISNIMNNNYRCTRVKVPRNDGTNYADYLLEDEAINDIVVDGANRKWLATSSSGVYLVSDNGTEILENHTTDNSLIPSNLVYDMTMNDASGELFVATDLGVASYRSDVSEVAPNYDNVIVFPNPVRPDYTGWITIQGLMDNSLVKITDVSGNLFSQGYANGGTYLWDGRTAAGERVKTGVYLVYASQSGGSSGVVAKVMVVN